MSQTQTSLGTSARTKTATDGAMTTDRVEDVLQTIDSTTVESTGVSLFHILTIGSIGASIALFASGKRMAGIFVGLWPPTFQALKSVVDKNSKTYKQ